MDISSILSFITALLATGSVLYLIFDKKVRSPQEKADTQTTIIANGNEIADLYVKIEEIVQAKLRPFKEDLEIANAKAEQSNRNAEEANRRLEEANRKLDDIQRHWCCYREGCLDRVMSKELKSRTLEEDVHDQVCK